MLHQSLSFTNSGLTLLEWQTLHARENCQTRQQALADETPTDETGQMFAPRYGAEPMLFCASSEPVGCLDYSIDRADIAA